MIEHFFTAPFLFLYFIVPRLRHQRGGGPFGPVGCGCLTAAGCVERL
jgi:hypothetical protein